MANLKFNGAGVLPYTVINGQTYFVLGEERGKKVWADFGGARDKHEKRPQKTASRECYEEFRKIIKKDKIANVLGKKPVIKTSVNHKYVKNLSHYHMYLANFTGLVGNSKQKAEKTIKKFSKSRPKGRHYLEKNKITLVSAKAIQHAIQHATNQKNVSVKDYKGRVIQMRDLTAGTLSIAIPKAGQNIPQQMYKVLKGQKMTKKFEEYKGQHRI